MATIGVDSTSGMTNNGEASTTVQKIFDYASIAYTAGSGEEVYQIGIHVGTPAGDSAGVDIGVYDVTGGISGATLVGVANTGTISAGGRHVVSVGPWALTSGRTYAVAWSIRSTTNVQMYRVNDGATRTRNGAATGSTTLADPWSGTTAAFYRYAVFATTRAASSSSLTDVDTDEQVYSEQTVQTQGTGLSAGTSLTYKGISASLVTSTSSLSIRATFPNFFTNGIKLGKDFPFIAGVSTLTVSTTSRLNWKYTVIGTPDASATANLAYGLSLSTSDIIVFPKYLMSNGVTTSYTLTISTDSSFIADVGGGSGSYSFQYFIWDESTSDYGTTATYGLNYSSTGGVTPLAVGNIWQWIFQTETSTGGMTDKIKTYLAAQGYTGATNEALFNWLGSLGYTGALADRISQFERANTTRYG